MQTRKTRKRNLSRCSLFARQRQERRRVEGLITCCISVSTQTRNGRRCRRCGCKISRRCSARESRRCASYTLHPILSHTHNLSKSLSHSLTLTRFSLSLFHTHTYSLYLSLTHTHLKVMLRAQKQKVRFRAKREDLEIFLESFT